MQTTRRFFCVRRSPLHLFFIALTALLTCCGPLVAQQLTGKWAIQEAPLDNGDTPVSILALTQNGTALTGNFTHNFRPQPVAGTVTGQTFEVHDAANPSRTILHGEIVNGELHATRGNRNIVLRPATADELRKPAYIEPPALHTVPYNGLAKTPPMGWNSWNLFAGRIDDKTVRGIADAMVSSGMRDAGYIYVNIDDTWEGHRDASGVLHSNSKFPDMKALADYVHSKGLKLGIYSSPGPTTCAGYPASYGHEEQDAKTFAGWGIDYLKYDWCSAGGIYTDAQLQPVYQKMADALQASGRPIVFSLCEYGNGAVQTWGAKVSGNLWRTTGDIRDEWSSMLANIEKQAPTAPYAGPGHWNDPDMLEIGNGHMSADEYRTHMGLWALTAAPLLAGNDIRNMSPETKSILLNREVIAIDQDTLGRQAAPVKQGNLELWVKPLADGGVAVGMVNVGDAPTPGTIQVSGLNLPHSPTKARDVWTHTDVKFTNGGYTATIPPHGILMLRLPPR